MTNAVKVFNKLTGMMTSEEFFTTDKQAEDRYIEYIRILNSRARKGEEYFVSRFSDGRVMCAEVVVGTR
jgi:hypothetical protein